ncbi:unnamed protein product [Mortierella alpina]
MYLNAAASRMFIWCCSLESDTSLKSYLSETLFLQGATRTEENSLCLCEGRSDASLQGSLRELARRSTRTKRCWATEPMDGEACLTLSSSSPYSIPVSTTVQMQMQVDADKGG